MTTTLTDRRNGVNGGAAIKAPCRAATTASITLSGLQTIDGVTLVANDRVLVKNQSTASQNGIYCADTGDWNRAPDFDGRRDIVKGTIVLITDGSTNGQTTWEVTTSDPVIGTSSLTFSALGSSAFTAASTYSPASLADLKALADRPALVVTRYRSSVGDGGGGMWTFRTGDQSANVTADARSALWAAPDSASTGASGAWQRIYSGMPISAWWGTLGDNTADNSTAANAIIAFVNATGGYVFWPRGAYKFGSALNAITSYGGGFVGEGRGHVGEVSGTLAGASGTVFRSNFVNGTLLTLTGARQFHLSDISFWPSVFRGFGDRTTNTFEVRVGASTSQCTLERLKFSYCGTPVQFYDAINCTLRDVYFFATWGASCVLTTGTSSPNTQGAIIMNCQSFQPWQIREPIAADMTSWSTSTAYTTGKKVRVNNGIWECTTAGTSSNAGSGPTVPAYTDSSGDGGPLGMRVTDGTVVWTYVLHASLCGVLIDSYSQEMWLTDCQWLTAYNGVKASDTANAASTAPFNIIIENGLIDRCVGDGVVLTAGRDVKIVGLLCNYSATGCGLKTSGTFGGSLTWVGGHIAANALHGVHLTVGDEYEFASVECAGNSIATASTSSGYKIEGIDGIRIHGGRAGAMGGYSNAMAYGIEIDGSCTAIGISDVDVRGNTTAGIVNASGYSATKRIHDCIGFVTANSGTGAVASGATTAVVSHGLGGTPTLGGITIVFGEQGANDYGRWSIGTITSTQFTLTVAVDPGASNLDFGWRATLNT